MDLPASVPHGTSWILELSFNPVTPAGKKWETSPLYPQVALERDVMAFPADDVKAVLSVVAPRVDDSHRAPLRLVAVLDKSGSMNGEKIRLVKQTMIFMLRYLSDKDALGVVEYGSDVKVVAPLTLCDQDGRTRLQHAIERIQISGQLDR